MEQGRLTSCCREFSAQYTHPVIDGFLGPFTSDEAFNQGIRYVATRLRNGIPGGPGERWSPGYTAHFPQRALVSETNQQNVKHLSSRWRSRA